MNAPSSLDRDIAALRRITIFRSLDDHALAALASLGRARRYRARDPLPGALGACAYAVSRGSFRLYRSDQDGNEVTLDVFGPGDAFVLSETVEYGDARSGAVVLGDAVIYLLPLQELLRMLGRYPTALLDIIAYLHRRLAGSYAHIEEIALYNVQSRLAHELLRRAGGGDHVVATRTQLAAWIATGPERVMRGLGDFRDRGWIAFAPRSPEIVILQPDALAHL